MYKYETHLHTAPVSKCAQSSVEEALKFYKELGYDGVFVTNHFLDGNINILRTEPYEDRINFYFSDYEKASELSEEIGIKVFLGVEVTYGGTDFLVYGLDKEWYLNNPQIMDMKKSEELRFFRDNGALVIQAHPFRRAGYIDHIRLFPDQVDGVEIINSSRVDADNEIARIYAEHYELLKFAGSDTHDVSAKKKFAGMCSDEPVVSVADFIEKMRGGKMEIFTKVIE